jgi:arginine deiminase
MDEAGEDFYERYKGYTITSLRDELAKRANEDYASQVTALLQKALAEGKTEEEWRQQFTKNGKLMENKQIVESVTHAAKKRNPTKRNRSQLS